MPFGIDDIAYLGAGALSAGSSIFGGLLGASGQSATNAQQMAMFQQQMQFNAAEAEKNRDFQKEMSSTAWQRGMSDMKAAGLNPILAANLGGASSPGGGAASIGGAPSLGNPGDFLGRGVSSAGGAAAMAAQVKATIAQSNKDESATGLNKANEDYTKSNTALNSVIDAKLKQETATSAAQQKVAEENARNVQADTNLKGIQAITEFHNSNSAYERSRIEATERWKRENVGTGHAADILNTGVRSTATTLKGAWGAYSDYIGKPFAEGVNTLVKKLRGQ